MFSEILQALEQSNGSSFTHKRIAVSMESFNRCEYGAEFCRVASGKLFDDIVRKIAQIYVAAR
jgi:hypothetical protein